MWFEGLHACGWGISCLTTTADLSLHLKLNLKIKMLVELAARTANPGSISMHAGNIQIHTGYAPSTVAKSKILRESMRSKSSPDSLPSTNYCDWALTQWSTQKGLTLVLLTVTLARVRESSEVFSSESFRYWSNYMIVV